MKRISEIIKQINSSKDGKTVFANFGYLSLLQVAGYVFPAQGELSVDNTPHH